MSIVGDNLKARDQLPRQLQEKLSIWSYSDPFGMRTKVKFSMATPSDGQPRSWEVILDADGNIPGWFLAKLAVEVP